jgi:hypothetical protein
MVSAGASNIGHLKAHDEQLVRLGLLAVRYFPDDPNTYLLKLRQLAESLAQISASRVGVSVAADEKRADLLRRLQDRQDPNDEPADAMLARLRAQAPSIALGKTGSRARKPPTHSRRPSLAAKVV